MEVIFCAIVGIVIGAVGSEILRAKKPKFIDKIEGKAKQFVDSIYSEKTTKEQPRDLEDEDNSAAE